ncbi:hypothetical protein TNCV_4424041 [Trichonephila clavipes]|nr:hypothetical protein TNCV_4424041 [Trichonephila clavipes]
MFGYSKGDRGKQRAVKMGPGKRSKHSAGFKMKVIQFAKENGNHAAARITSNSLDDYLFMEESNSDGENDTDFDEDITEDEYADLFMLSNNDIIAAGSSVIAGRNGNNENPTPRKRAERKHFSHLHGNAILPTV